MARSRRAFLGSGVPSSRSLFEAAICKEGHTPPKKSRSWADISNDSSICSVHM